MTYTPDYIKEKLSKALDAVYISVTDESDGCGVKFSATIVSPKFEGKPLLHRHRMVNNILKEEMEVIHAFSQTTMTPQQWEESYTMDSLSCFSLKLSAPGKVILFGEYSVVFKKPAIAATLGLHTKLHLYKTNADTVQLNFSALELSVGFPVKDIQEYFNVAPADSWDSYLLSLTNGIEKLYEKTGKGFDLTDAQKFALIAFFHCFARCFTAPDGFYLKIDSELPVGSGVGSSASFSVVLSTAALLYEHFAITRGTSGLVESDNKGKFIILEEFKNQISNLAFSCEKIFHGSPSGVDHNTILRGSVLEFIKSDDNNNKMTYINTNALNILLVNTNVPRSTKKLVANVKLLKENHPDIIECVLSGMENVAKSAVEDLVAFRESQDNMTALESHFGDLISLNHNLLRVLGTSHPTLEHIVSTANKYELKAKLTGGGGGGFGFIYVPSNVEASVIKSVKQELTAAGFTVYDVSLGGPGLSVEEFNF